MLKYSIFVIKVIGLRPGICIIKATPAQTFFCQFCKILKIIFEFFYRTHPVAACEPFYLNVLIPKHK